MSSSSTISPPATPAAAVDRPVTSGDLQRFRIELLTEIAALLRMTGPSPTKQWLKSYEVRKTLHISPGTLQTLRNNGTVPYTRIGGTIYYDLEDIKKLLITSKRFKRHDRQ